MIVVLHCCSAIGIVIVVLLIGRRCTLVLCYRYSDSSITNRYEVYTIGIVIVVLLIGTRYTVYL